MTDSDLTISNKFYELVAATDSPTWNTRIICRLGMIRSISIHIYGTEGKEKYPEILELAQLDPEDFEDDGPDANLCDRIWKKCGGPTGSFDDNILEEKEYPDGSDRDFIYNVVCVIYKTRRERRARYMIEQLARLRQEADELEKELEQEYPDLAAQVRRIDAERI